ncbi:SBBP repeat-containing protein, partial [candidate division WOR-3 bacterium]|nr:SBBP repeat-containing protein [candidate division WOR-3 bacterium]
EGRADLLTLAYGKDDNLLWAEQHDGAARKDDYARAITVDDSSNVYVTGSSENANIVSQVSTVKYDKEGNIAWIATLKEKEPVEPLIMQPAYLHLGKQQDPAYLYIAAAVENSAALIRCNANGFYSARAKSGMRGKVCRPTALSGKCMAVECISNNLVKAYLVKFGPSELLGIARWD